MFRFLVIALLVGVAVCQHELSALKKGDAESQNIANAVKADVEKKNGAGSLSLNKVIEYKTRLVDTMSSSGGLTGALVYYLKIEASKGKYIMVHAMNNEDGIKFSSVKPTTKTAQIEGH
ncbi:uncharacterized protein LOC129589895 [Paramacrobiotus metropolitanus]|uniref:uncharacterized protein LOC129589895 n=1 Tax=Paramacrobiotus metropolitanus TaxID=2943436 RepID=UPI002445EFAE|nr:uncharacterized protein LOC129589895 [Paramacrobiotus metropolitanus]